MKALGMVLPQSAADGTVSGGFAYSSDDRVPSRLRRPEDYFDDAPEPRRVGTHLNSSCSPHLFDVIESSIEHEIEDDDARHGYRYEQDFRARLTCVKCGLVLGWEGRRTKDEHIASLSPEPLVVGDLVAQMVHSDRIGGRHDWSRYDVLRSTPGGFERIGSLTPGRGQRGRQYYAGVLDGWALGDHVEGKDALSALRAIARRERVAMAS